VAQYFTQLLLFQGVSCGQIVDHGIDNLRMDACLAANAGRIVTTPQPLKRRGF
jgi:hypothetical protein